MFPSLSKNDTANVGWRNAELSRGFFVIHTFCAKAAHFYNLIFSQFGMRVRRSRYTELSAQDMRSVAHLLLPRYVFQIIGAIVFFAAILVINFAFGGARSDEGFSYESVDVKATWFSVAAQHERSIPAPIRARTENASRAGISITRFHSADLSVAGHFVPSLVSYDRFPSLGHKYPQLGNSIVSDLGTVNTFFERVP